MESILIYGVTVMSAVVIIWYNFIKFRKQQTSDLQRFESMQKVKIGKPLAQHPTIEPALCLGCGTCIRACPEEGALGIVFGKAQLINPAQCVGHGSCESACPVNAITMGFSDESSKKDMPVLDDVLQTNIPNIYIAGELGGISLIKNAITEGVKVAKALTKNPSPDASIYDVLIVGAGPAVLSAALTAKEQGLSFAVVDQQPPGGTILQFPRKKLVMTQPVTIPLYGKLKKSEYRKEELLDIWDIIIDKFNLNILPPQKIESIIPQNNYFSIESKTNTYSAHQVILAMGRRGTPRKLDVPGEHLSKVTYQLIDAQSYQDNDILVVGGGDSAIEAAIGLARQPGNRVYISYRKAQFFRLKAKNEQRINQLIANKQIIAIFESQVMEIQEKRISLKTKEGGKILPNDYVFVMVGGVPPFSFLKNVGIQFYGDVS